MQLIIRFLYYLLKFPNKRKLSPFSKTVKFGNFCNFSFYPKAKIVLGEKVNIRNYCNILVGNKAELILEEGIFMNNYCSINCLERIEIGENTLFGEGVKLYDHNHRYGIDGVEHKKFSSESIKIGKNCWLGSNVIVLKGVTIGDNCIIGAGCVVYKDIPANSLIINKQEHIVKPL